MEIALSVGMVNGVPIVSELPEGVSCVADGVKAIHATKSEADALLCGRLVTDYLVFIVDDVRAELHNQAFPAYAMDYERRHGQQPHNCPLGIHQYFDVETAERINEQIILAAANYILNEQRVELAEEPPERKEDGATARWNGPNHGAGDSDR